MPNVVDLIRSVRFVGWKNIARALAYTVRRDRLDQAFQDDPQSFTVRRPGPLLSAERTPRGALLHFRDASLEVHFLAADFVRLTWQPGRLPPPYALTETPWPEVQVGVQREGHSTSLRTDSLELRVSEDGGLVYLDEGGRRIRLEYPPEWKGPGPVHRTRLRAEERVHGLGERAAPFDLRPGHYRLWNHDPGGRYEVGDDPLYLSLPVLFTLHDKACLLVFYENSCDGEVLVEDPLQVSFREGALRYYVACGTPQVVLRRFTKLTGRPALPPRWSLGYHQSRWGYTDETQVREVLEGFRAHGLPLSAIHLDIDYMDGYRVFSVDEGRFPHFKELVRDAARQGVHLVTILDPGVKRDTDYALYQEGLSEGVFCRLPDGSLSEGVVWPGWSVFPDFTDPAARRWWARGYQSLQEQGVAGFWHDMNEPTSFTAWGEMGLPRATQHDLDGQGGDHRQAHNLYGLLMNRAGCEALRQSRPQQRPWILSRSGWVGGSRYAWNWTGDTESTWEGLKLTLATVLNLGLSGVPFTGSDIGGFSGSPTPELHTRWFQMAAFMPLFRTHSARGTARREPWSFDSETLEILRRFLRLRHSLIPYLYTLAWRTSERGVPPVRPLFWIDLQDRQSWAVEDAFMLGDALLVAPVFEANARSRHVYLPAGAWYDFWEEGRYPGSQHVEFSAPLERIPVLARAGTILPTQRGEALALDIYPTAAGRAKGEVFSDAGDGYGDWRLDRFNLRQEGGQSVLSRESEGSYPLPYKRFEIRLHGVAVQSAAADGQRVPLEKQRVHIGPFRSVQFILDSRE